MRGELLSLCSSEASRGKDWGFDVSKQYATASPLPGGRRAQCRVSCGLLAAVTCANQNSTRLGFTLVRPTHFGASHTTHLLAVGRALGCEPLAARAALVRHHPVGGPVPRQQFDRCELLIGPRAGDPAGGPRPRQRTGGAAASSWAARLFGAAQAAIAIIYFKINIISSIIVLCHILAACAACAAQAPIVISYHGIFNYIYDILVLYYIYIISYQVMVAIPRRTSSTSHIIC